MHSSLLITIRGCFILVLWVKVTFDYCCHIPTIHSWTTTVHPIDIYYRGSSSDATSSGRNEHHHRQGFYPNDTGRQQQQLTNPYVVLWTLNTRRRKVALMALNAVNGNVNDDSTIEVVSDSTKEEEEKMVEDITAITTTNTTTNSTDTPIVATLDSIATNIEQPAGILNVPSVTTATNTPIEMTADNTNDNQINKNHKKKQRRVAILVCPAQFCVPADYDSLFTVLKEQIYNDNNNNNDNITIGTCHVCPLPRTEWIKVSQQIPTMNFWTAQLPIEPTLHWYFSAIESSLNHIIASEQLYRTNQKNRNDNNDNDNNDDDDDDNEFSICMIGHSIGGWVARAYLGGLSLSSSALYTYTKQHISSFITLGTPHISPSTALVDQTRGLLAAIATSTTCTPQSLIDTSSNYRNEPLEITCVCSSAISGNFVTTNVEELVAASSYLPLTGKGNGVMGDGIVPLELAFLDHPAKRMELRDCLRTQQPIRHCHVVPTPWNLLDGYAPSIAWSSDTFPSYISDGVVQQWAHCIR